MYLPVPPEINKHQWLMTLPPTSTCYSLLIHHCDLMPVFLPTMSMQNDSFFHEVARRLRQEISRIKGPQVAMLCKSFANLKFTDRDFFEAASHRLQQTVTEIGIGQVGTYVCGYTAEPRACSGLASIYEERPLTLPNI